MSSKSFKDSNLYPVVFMLIACVVFVGVLAYMYRGSEKKIDEYKQGSYQKLVLSLLSDVLAEYTGSNASDILNSYPESFIAYIKEINIPGLSNRVFVAEISNQAIGYCVEIKGKGLWGSMKALVALSSDMKELQGISIYEQMETPGLGARIGEDWFVEQFKGIRIVKDNAVPGDYLNSFELIPEGKQADNPLQIRQITGATITTSSVVKMLTEELSSIYEVFVKQADL